VVTPEEREAFFEEISIGIAALILAELLEREARVVVAVKSGEKIAVFGDYDVDGSCSAALMHGFLAAVAAAPRLYIPDRLTEGYGPNAAALLKLIDVLESLDDVQEVYTSVVMDE